jgi:hypothetical protein
MSRRGPRLQLRMPIYTVLLYYGLYWSQEVLRKVAIERRGALRGLGAPREWWCQVVRGRLARTSASLGTALPGRPCRAVSADLG